MKTNMYINIYMKKVLIKCCLIMPAFFFIPSLIAQTTNEPVRKETGYFNLISLSAIIGTPNDYFETNSIVPSLTMVNGFQLNKHFSAGIGLGAEIFEYAVFPVFADFRYKLPHSGYQPYFALKGGYAFGKSNKQLMGNYYYFNKYNNTGGWMFSPEVGIYFAVSSKIDLAVSLGYRFQQLESELLGIDYEGKLSGYVDNYKTTFNRLSFNIGFILR